MSFFDIPVSTQTYIVHSNIISVDLMALSDVFEPTDIFINMTYKKVFKGTPRVIKRKKKKFVRTFLNCVSISVLVKDKHINVKVFNNGVFQITGCKRREHADDCIKLIINLINQYGCYQHKESQIIVYLVSVMRNIDFDLAFNINREALATFVHDNTDYKVPPLTKGYMGIKIKIPLENVDDLLVNCISFDKNTIEIIDEFQLSYKTLMTDIVKDLKKLRKERFISISVFQNGKVLMSGIDEVYQLKYYNWFAKFINDNKEHVWTPSISKSKKTFKIQ